MNVTGPANDMNQPCSAHWAARSAPPEKQWKTTRSGAPSSQEHAHDVVMGIPVVDDQRLAELLGQRDVAAERLLLRMPALRPGAEVVEAGLADRHHPLVRGQLADLGERVVEGAGRGQPRCLVRMQRDGSHDLRVCVAPPRRRSVSSRRRTRPGRPVTPTAAACRSASLDGEPGAVLVDVVRDVEVAVAVGNSDRQGFR